MRQNLDKAEDKAKGSNKPLFTMERPANGLPEDLQGARQADVRHHRNGVPDRPHPRSASLLLVRDLSAMIYPFLGVGEGHHSASHDNLSAGYERIARFHLGQLAYLAQKLDSMPEGEGSVLDNSCLMFLSNLWIGRNHDNTRLPLVLAGGLGGTLETGRALNYLEESEENRKMCSLYLSILDRMGIEMDKFGDAEERLARL
ncbi:MAG: hypothetical protein R2748_15480 [Bryobacterales bacterium]